MIVGIDLGTTNSLVGIWRDGRIELIPNALDSTLTPSAVYIDEDESVHVGMAARERLSTHPNHSAASFKRDMGSNRRFRLRDRELNATELSALVLRSLKSDAERYLQCAVEKAVITVPAYFNDFQRKATKAAAELAGLQVVRLLNEPTAAALAHGIHEQTRDRKILVLDLGGGTFDVSILEMFDGIMEVRASTGDNRLGGEDFVELLMDAYISAVGATAGIPPRATPSQLHGLLRHQAELAKRQLSVQAEAEMQMVVGEESVRWIVTRERFEALSEPLMVRILSTIERAIRDAGLTPAEIGNVVLVGGATRMPMIQRMAARLFKFLPTSIVDPDEAVARGAALQAALIMRDAALEDLVMTDVAPFSLGMSSNSRLADGTLVVGVFQPIIERNTVIPASRSKSFFTIATNQPFMRVAIFQGESRLASDNIFLGELMVPVPSNVEGAEGVDVRFTYDASGLLEVEAENSVKQKFSLVIEGNAGILSKEEIAVRLAKLAALKVHPLDQAPNQAVLARAGRIYEERLGEVRAAVGRSIDLFRYVLNQQDPAEIQAHRQRFATWLDSIDSRVFS